MVSSVAPVAPAARRKESLAEALHRLAAKAHDEGLVILSDLPAAAPYACRVTSSRPGHAPYVVNLAPGMLHGCDCAGYFRHQRCKHYCLALEAAGWLPDLPEDAEEGAPERAPVLAPWFQDRESRRAAAAADLEACFPSLHPARPVDLAVA